MQIGQAASGRGVSGCIGGWMALPAHKLEHKLYEVACSLVAAAEQCECCSCASGSVVVWRSSCQMHAAGGALCSSSDGENEQRWLQLDGRGAASALAA
ncbi:hypothetical protein C2E21_9378 [Chlorella sorokiniana]|uniref:Uncharacterized protein n=1 Tax=Chlorella sorokiniana TaxID=3076 RepID=A0A2P6TBL6_CHLSO|nr:hypothetical protein C2E21_9378 [Chlorella sorokiniana]|eukprot:PRW05937.1 hypothetical protein C2E21_9378 [Chlorella sorokiniana]